MGSERAMKNKMKEDELLHKLKLKKGTYKTLSFEFKAVESKQALAVPANFLHSEINNRN